jgi:hypothetical protein
LPALLSLDFGVHYYWLEWPVTVHAPFTYLRLALMSINDLICIMSTQQLSCTLRQLHVTIDNGNYHNYCTAAISNRLIPMVNLHTFTFFKAFFSHLIIRWTFMEFLTSSNVMPVLRRANMSFFINTNDLNCIGSSPLFTDHRHVDVHFAFSLINCPQYTEVTQYIPHGSRFHPREILGATFVVNRWSNKSEWLTDGDPFVSYCFIIFLFTFYSTIKFKKIFLLYLII